MYVCVFVCVLPMSLHNRYIRYLYVFVCVYVAQVGALSLYSGLGSHTTSHAEMHNIPSGTCKRASYQLKRALYPLKRALRPLKRVSFCKSRARFEVIRKGLVVVKVVWGVWDGLAYNCQKKNRRATDRLRGISRFWDLASAVWRNSNGVRGNCERSAGVSAVYICICLCTHIYVQRNINLYSYVCIYIYMYVSLHMKVYLYMYICI